MARGKRSRKGRPKRTRQQRAAPADDDSAREEEEEDEEEGNEQEEEEPTVRRKSAKKSKVQDAEEEDDAMEVEEEPRSGSSSGGAMAVSANDADVEAVAGGSLGRSQAISQALDVLLLEADGDAARVTGTRPMSVPSPPRSVMHETEEASVASTTGGSSSSGLRRRSNRQTATVVPPPPRIEASRRSSRGGSSASGGGGGSNAHVPRTSEQQQQQTWTAEAHNLQQRRRSGRSKAAESQQQEEKEEGPASTSSSTTQGPSSSSAVATGRSPAPSSREKAPLDEQGQRAEARRLSTAVFAGPFLPLARLLTAMLVAGAIAWALLSQPQRRQPRPQPSPVLLEPDIARLGQTLQARVRAAMSSVHERVQKEASAAIAQAEARARARLSLLDEVDATVVKTSQRARVLQDRLAKLPAAGSSAKDVRAAEVVKLREGVEALARLLPQLQGKLQALGAGDEAGGGGEAKSSSSSSLRGGTGQSRPTPVEEEVHTRLASLQAVVQGPHTAVDELLDSVLPTLRASWHEEEEQGDAAVAAALPTVEAPAAVSSSASADEAARRHVHQAWQQARANATLPAPPVSLLTPLAAGVDDLAKSSEKWLLELQAALEVVRPEVEEAAAAEGGTAASGSGGDGHASVSPTWESWLREAVGRLLTERMAWYQALGSSEPDWASARNGASVLRRLTSSTGDRRHPELALSDSLELGDCYPLPIPGNLTVRLKQPVRPTAFGLSHISRHVSVVRGSRPREVRLWGWTDPEAKDDHPILLADRFVWVVSEGDNELHHTFELPPPSSSLAGTNGTAQGNLLRRPISAVTLEVLGSSGHPNMTCLYRFRLHGEPQPAPADSVGPALLHSMMEEATRRLQHEVLPLFRQLKASLLK